MHLEITVLEFTISGFFFLIRIPSVRFIVSEIGYYYTTCQKTLFVNVSHILEEIRIPQMRGLNSYVCGVHISVNMAILLLCTAASQHK